MAQSREECIRQAQSNFTPEERRKMWGSENLEALSDAELMDGIQREKFTRRSAKTGEIISDSRMSKVARYINDYQEKNGFSDNNRRKAIENILVRSTDDTAGRTSIEANSQAITASYQARIARAAEALKPGRLGWKKQVQLLDDLADELHMRGSTNNPLASKFADDVGRVLEDLRLRFNNAGGSIKKLSDWALPHSSNASKMAKARLDKYKVVTRPLLNRERMVNQFGRPMTDAEIDETLEATFNNIVGETAQEGGQGQKAIANRHQEHRALHFRGGKEYRAYAQHFGHENYYKVITDHIERLGREIALMETLGSNPAKSFESLSKGLPKHFALGHKAIFDNLVGLNRPDDNLLTAFGSTVRPVLSAAQLGSAILSSFSDIGTASVAAAFNGLGWSRMLSRLTELGGAEARTFAAQMGGSIDYALDNVGMAMRFDDAAGADWSQRLADTVFRASGLNAFTNVMRRAHFMEMLYQFGNNSGSKFGDLEPRFKAMLYRYGVTELEWNQIRKTRKRERNGEKFLDPMSIKDETLQTKLLSIVHQERDLAVLMPDVRTKAFMNQGQEEGTLLGAGLRAFGQYKSYSVMMVLNNLYRYSAQKNLSMGTRLGYVSSLVAVTTLLGGLSVQLKEIAKGRDPRNVRDPRFFQAALLQGGGLGILGDFAFSDSNRYGQPGWVAFAGPTGGLAWDAYKAGKGVATGDPGKASNLLRYVPGQSVWYTRLIYERAVIDQFRRLTDPDFDKKTRTQVKKRRTEHGQEYWSKPGTGISDARLPDITATVEKPKKTYEQAAQEYVPGGKKKTTSGNYVPNI